MQIRKKKCDNSEKRFIDLNSSSNMLRSGLHDIIINNVYHYEVTITRSMVDEFAKITADFSSIHMDDNFAMGRGFRSRVVHGAYTISLLTMLIGMYLPGENAILQSISSNFLAPIYIGDRIRFIIEVEHISIATKTLILRAIVVNSESAKILVKSKVQVGFTN